MSFRTTWWLPTLLIGVVGTYGVGQFALEVLQGAPAFWPALAVFGGALWGFLVVVSVQMIRVPANRPGPMTLARRHEGVEARWEPHAYRLWVGIVYGLYQVFVHLLFVGLSYEGMVSPTPFDRTLFAVAFALAMLSLGLGLLASGVHVLVRGDVRLRADADEVSVQRGRSTRTFTWATLAVRVANGTLWLKDATGSIVIPVTADEAMNELVEVLASRAGRADDRLAVSAPSELRALVEQ